MRVATRYDVEGNIPALDAVLAELESVRPDAVVFGGDLLCGARTQFDRRVDGYRIVNSGSMGAAWESEPGAYWALIEDGHVELRRTDYDVDAAI